MNKKDLSLLVLILVVGAVVAFINPRFLYVGNLSNTLNQVGMFGIFSIAEAFVIIIGGIELSVGSVIALLGVIFIDLIVNHDVNWVIAVAAVIAGGLVIGLVHGALVTRMHIQPFVVTLCGLLIYRGAARYYTEDATAGFGFGASFPTLEWLTAGRTNVLGFPLPHSVIALVIVAGVAWVLLHRSVFGRYLYAVGKNDGTNLDHYIGFHNSRGFACSGNVATQLDRATYWGVRIDSACNDFAVTGNVFYGAVNLGNVDNQTTAGVERVVGMNA